MFSFAILSRVYSDCCIDCSHGDFSGHTISNIQLIQSTEPEIREHTVYIGGVVEILRFLQQHRDRQGLMCIACGYMPELDTYFNQEDICLLSCSITPEEISNRATQSYFQFTCWQNTLYEMCTNVKDISAVLAHGAKGVGAPVFLLNSGYRLVAANVEYAFEHPVIQQLLSSGYLCAENIDMLVNGKLPTSKQEGRLESIIDKTSFSVLEPIKYRSGIYGRLLIISEQGERDCGVVDYAVLLGRHLLNHAKIHIKEGIGGDTEFSSLIEDIIDKKISSDEELQNRLFRLPTMPEKLYTCIVVAFEGDQQFLPVGFIGQTLEKIFPFSRIASYHGDLIVLSYKQNQQLVPQYDAEALDALLKQYNGWASIGNNSAFIRSVRQIYLQTKGSIALARALNQDPDVRVFSSDDYTVYHIIDLCARSGYEFHENNLVYLCTPKYTALKRYDEQKQDNLCDIMKCYIQNNCNTSQTAKTLHFHRNTMLNKISKIESIVGGSLNNWDLQFKLMMSSVVAEYAETYCQDNLFRLKTGAYFTPQPLDEE